MTRTIKGVTMKKTFLLFFCLIIFLFANMPVAITQDEVVEGSFGNFFAPSRYNWTRFWKVFNQHSVWDLEYNNGTGWISDKSQLHIILNYTRRTIDDNNTLVYMAANKTDADSCKITLNFTAKYTGDYRLTFGIDLDVKNYTHKESTWNYTLSYQNYTVYFDWSDIKNLPLDSVNHGIQPVGDESYFWFRIRKNNVQEGVNVVIDPSFGESSVSGASTYTAAYDRMYTCKATLPEDADITEMSFYGSGDGGSVDMTLSIYNDDSDDPNNLEGVTEEITVSTSTQWWHFSMSLSLSAGEYWLTWNQNGGGANRDVDYYFFSDSGAARWKDDEYDDGFPASFGSGNNLDKRLCIYANYTVSGAQEYSEEFSESINILANQYIWKSLTETYTETYAISDSHSSLIALSLIFENIITVTDNMENWKALTQIFIETISISAIMDTVKELTYLFTESFTETIQINSVSTVLSETAVTFIEFMETVIIGSTPVFSTDLVTTLTEVLALAAIGFIIALCALSVALTKKD